MRAEDDAKRAYLRKKTRAFADRPDKLDRALVMLDQLWPLPEDRPMRIAWLASNWPDLAAIELEREPADDAILEALGGVAFAVDPEALDRLGDEHGIDEEFRREAEIVRRAAELLASGRDEEFETTIRQIGLRSPHRDARLFLKGLAAAYEGRVDDASRAFEKLHSSGSVLAGPAFRLMENPGDDSRVCELCDHLAELAEAGKAESAARELSQGLKGLESVDADAVVRALASELGRNLEPGRVISLLRRHHVECTDDPSLDRLHGSLLDRRGWTAIEPWESAARWFERHPGAHGSDHEVAHAAVLAKLGDAFMIEAVDAPWSSGAEQQEFRSRAVEALRTAARLDPECTRYSILLYEAASIAEPHRRRELAQELSEQFGDDPDVVRHVAAAAFHEGDEETTRALLDGLPDEMADDAVITLLRSELMMRDIMSGEHDPAEVDEMLETLVDVVRASDAPELIVDVLAFATAFELVNGPKSADVVGRHREEVEAAGFGPWDFAATTAKQFGKLGGEYSDEMLDVMTPPEPPTAADFVAALSLVTNSYRVARDRLLAELLDRAAASLTEDLSSADDYTLACEVLGPDAALKIGRRGLQLFGDDPLLGGTYYVEALNHGAPAEAFEGYLDRFETWILACENEHQIARLDGLAAEITDYLDELSTQPVQELLF